MTDPHDPWRFHYAEDLQDMRIAAELWASPPEPEQPVAPWWRVLAVLSAVALIVWWI